MAKRLFVAVAVVLGLAGAALAGAGVTAQPAAACAAHTS
jgi:hypothetical protein